MKRPLILVVDDMIPNLFIMTELIDHYLPECDVATTQSPNEALLIAAGREIDVAILDVQMPLMDGVELCRRLKNSPVSPNAPIMIVTGHTSAPGLRVRALEAGADDFISKPIDNVEMVARIKVMLRIKQAEDELRKTNAKLESKVIEKNGIIQDTEERFRAAVSAAGSRVWEKNIPCDAIIIYAPDETILHVNQTFLNIMGYSRDEALGQKISILWSKNYDSAYYRTIRKEALEQGHWNGLLITQNINGVEQELEMTISVVRNLAGEINNFVMVARDVTYEKDLKARLRQSQKMEAIGTLACGISHNFNNTLSVLHGFSDLAYETLPEGSETRQYIDEIHSATQRAKELVDQIMIFSRRGQAERKPINIGHATKEVMNLLTKIMPTNVDIQNHIYLDNIFIMGDPTQLHQIIMNLCTNAAHAIGKQGGRLLVELDEEKVDKRKAEQIPNLRPGQYAILTISDTGCGMDEATLSRIFEPFFTTKKISEGAGLGLAMVFGIVREYRGAVSVRSRPNEGTTFQVYLPVLDLEAILEEGRHDEPPAPLGHGEHILVVDDETPITRLLKVAMEHLEYKVTALSNSVDALDIFFETPNQFDIAILDQVMPTMTGTELAKEIHTVNPEISIILCTGRRDTIAPEDLESPEIYALLEKPIDIGKLGQTVRDALDAREKPSLQ